jgi:hypothetical protein
MLKSLKVLFIILCAVTFLTVIGATIKPTATEETGEIPFIDTSRDYWLAGERVPVENFDVLERFERELLVNVYRHSATIMILKRSTRHFPVIESILKENGIPEDFKYLAVAESDLLNATSPAGAKGYWQFMKGTAEDYGLEVSDDVDERNHLEKSTLAACRHIQSLKNRFGSWALAAAAYNMGASALSKEMELQKASRFYDLNLSEETNRYVFRILAFKEIMSQPEKYGFKIPRTHYYKPLSEYAIANVDTSIVSLGDFAKENKTSYRLLKVYNPWLRNRSLSVKTGRNYDIKIPKGNE